MCNITRIKNTELYEDPPQISFFAYYMGALLDQFLCIILRGPSHISFLILLTIWAPSDQPYRLLYGGPSDQFFHLLYRAPSG